MRHVVKSVIVTICLLASQLSWAGQITGGSDGWKDIGGVRQIPLRALQCFCEGTIAREEQDRLVCDFGDKQFKLRIGSPNIFIRGTTETLESPVIEIDQQVYVGVDLVRKLGWTCRPTPTGYAICPPGSNNRLLISSLGWEIRNKAVASNRKVGIWYIAFFTGKDEYKHWHNTESRKAAMPVGGRYDPSDPKVMERQWREMCECGIDFLVMDDTNTVWVDNSLIDRNIRAWFDFMDGKPQEERIEIVIAAGGELNQHSSRAGWTQAVDYLWDTFSHRPSYLRDKGKPVLHWYIERDVWTDWEDDRWTIRRTYHFFRTADQLKDGGWGYGSDRSPKLYRGMSLVSSGLGS